MIIVQKYFLPKKTTMKTKLPTLTLGFVLGILSVLVLGQSRPPQVPVPGRYTMVSTAGGVCVQDTATGQVKILPAGLVESVSKITDPAMFKGYCLFPGQPFESSPSVSPKSP
jgi:hypothetical protein